MFGTGLARLPRLVIASAWNFMIRGAQLAALLLTAAGCLLASKRRDTLVWGVTPLINYKYWSGAMREGGHRSITLVTHHYPAHKRDDFDIYATDLLPRWAVGTAMESVLTSSCVLAFIMRNASVFHTDFGGGILGPTVLRRLEAPLLRWAGIKTFLIPYGGDAQAYSELEPAVRNAMLKSYPDLGRRGEVIRRQMEYWQRHADAILCGFMLDGMSRWEMAVPNMLAVDLREWRSKSAYSESNGRNGPVTVLHTPNHRGIKGTEFIVEAVRLLRQQGLDVELRLLENVSNEVVRDSMQTADILAEQLILPGFGLNAIEGMASGLPVLSNLESEFHTRVFRRYAYLDECPVVSTSPETVARNLQALVTHPSLRAELGRAGAAYALKYHSYEACRRVFEPIYRRLLDGDKADLMDLFHPLKSGAAGLRIIHPLQEGRLPARYFL